MLYKDLRILHFHNKRKLSNGQLWKIQKETALIETWSYFIDVLAFELFRQIMPGVRIFFGFFDPRHRVLHSKAVPGVGILMEQISGLGVSKGGMVTGQIDTCITIYDV